MKIISIEPNRAKIWKVNEKHIELQWVTHALTHAIEGHCFVCFVSCITLALSTAVCRRLVISPVSYTNSVVLQMPEAETLRLRSSRSCMNMQWIQCIRNMRYEIKVEKNGYERHRAPSGAMTKKNQRNITTIDGDKDRTIERYGGNVGCEWEKGTARKR